MAVMLAAELLTIEVSRCSNGISVDMCHQVVSLAKKPAEKAKATAVKASLTFASTCSIRYMYLEVTFLNVTGSCLFLPKFIVARVFHVAYEAYI